MQTAIIGPGKVGSSLALFLTSLPHTVALIGQPDLSAESAFTGRKIRFLPQADAATLEQSALVIICVPDSQIQTVAGELHTLNCRPGHILHTSGIADTEKLLVLAEAGWQTASWHPLQSFPKKFMPPEIWQNLTSSFTGSEEILLQLQHLFQTTGITIQRVSAAQKQVLHLAATVISNLQVGLHSMAAGILEQSGLNAEETLTWLIPLSLQTAENIARSGYSSALSGPLQRGDKDTIQRHLQILQNLTDPGIIEIYRRLSQKMLDDPRLAEKLIHPWKVLPE